MQRITAADDGVLDSDGNYIFRDDAVAPAVNTIIAADFLNAVQEELANLVTSSGQTLSTTDNKQVAKAIRNANAILVNTTLLVNGAGLYPKLSDAFEFLRGKYIGPSVVVTIQLQTGMTHTQSSPLFVTHPQGEKIIIKGNDADPTTTLLAVNADNFSREQGAITVEAGGRIGGMSGFTLYQDTSGTPQNFPVFGLKASAGGRMKIGNVRVQGFRGSNIIAQSGGNILADGTNSSLANVQAGFSSADKDNFGNNWHARDTGSIIVANATSASAYRSNFVAESNGVIRMDGCNSISAPITARHFGTIKATSCTQKGNANGGFIANECGQIYALSCISGGSAGFGNGIGFTSYQGSKIFAYSCTASYNTAAGFFCDAGSHINGDFNSSSSNGTYGYQIGKFSYIQTPTGGTGNGTALNNLSGPSTTLISYAGT